MLDRELIRRWAKQRERQRRKQAIERQIFAAVATILTTASLFFSAEVLSIADEPVRGWLFLATALLGVVIGHLIWRFWEEIYDWVKRPSK